MAYQVSPKVQKLAEEYRRARRRAIAGKIAAGNDVLAGTDVYERFYKERPKGLSEQEKWKLRTDLLKIIAQLRQYQQTVQQGGRVSAEARNSLFKDLLNYTKEIAKAELQAQGSVAAEKIDAASERAKALMEERLRIETEFPKPEQLDSEAYRKVFEDLNGAIAAANAIPPSRMAVVLREYPDVGQLSGLARAWRLAEIAEKGTDSPPEVVQVGTNFDTSLTTFMNNFLDAPIRERPALLVLAADKLHVKPEDLVQALLARAGPANAAAAEAVRDTLRMVRRNAQQYDAVDREMRQALQRLDQYGVGLNKKLREFNETVLSVMNKAFLGEELTEQQIRLLEGLGFQISAGHQEQAPQEAKGPQDEATERALQYLEAIDGMAPQDPWIEQLRKQIITSADFQRYKEQMGYTDEDYAFKAFLRDARAATRQGRWQDRRREIANVLTGRSPRAEALRRAFRRMFGRGEEPETQPAPTPAVQEIPKAPKPGVAEDLFPRREEEEDEIPKAPGVSRAEHP